MQREAKIKDAFKLYKYILNNYKNTALLESLGEFSEEVSQYSIIGVIAGEQLYEKENNYYIKSFKSNQVISVDDWQAVIDEWIGPLGKSSNPFQTGAIGYLGYELNRCFEIVPYNEKLKSPISKICLVRYDLLYVYDRKSHQAFWISQECMDDEINIIEKQFENSKFGSLEFYTFGETEKDFEYENYLNSISECVECIKNGDMLQANITMRFHGQYKGSPFVLYEALRNSTPNPFFAYLDFDEKLISTSPESFISVSNGAIVSRPIKGTVRVEIDGQDQSGYLEQSRKNCSENVMIADLIRNDIGRISKIGTVSVPILCGTKKFNQIYHLETVVKGQLKDNVMLSDMLRATFPGGSITGAPKVKAMEIIDRLEFAERGPYCGAIGFFGSSGFLSTSIGIRIIYFSDNKYYLHAGGGIVVGSDPQEEYDELLLKVESLIKTLNKFNVLYELRDKLDKINVDLLRLISKRTDIIKEITAIKNENNIPIVQKNRMEEILFNAYKINKDEKLNIPKSFIDNLFAVIFNESMKIEGDES
ncbi:MAG: chorismate-binding protein [Clostridia bacterium]|nr:chorismate-binding protein [Clostridia bacterium]